MNWEYHTNYGVRSIGDVIRILFPYGTEAHKLAREPDKTSIVPMSERPAASTEPVSVARKKAPRALILSPWQAPLALPSDKLGVVGLLLGMGGAYHHVVCKAGSGSQEG